MTPEQIAFTVKVLDVLLWAAGVMVVTLIVLFGVAIYSVCRERREFLRRHRQDERDETA